MIKKDTTKSKRSSKQVPENEEPTERVITTHKAPTFEKQDIETLEIAALESHGFNREDIRKMQQTGIWTVQGLSCVTKRRLLDIKGFTDVKINKIQEAIDKITPLSFRTGFEMYEKQMKTVFITTGSKNIDEILGGGIECGAITVIYGESGIGKTQFALNLCVTSNLSIEKSGGEGRVLYVDTKGTFNGERVVQIAERFGLDAEELLKKITVVVPTNTDQLLKILSEIRQRFLADKHSLLVIDSITNLYRTDYTGRAELADRQMHLNHVLRELAKITHEFGVAVFLTNEMTAIVDGGIFDHRKGIGIGGNILRFGCHTILYARGTVKNRILRLEKCAFRPEKETQFTITEGGIMDNDESN